MPGWLTTNYGDLASLAGLVVSLAGFGVTIVAVLRSKGAAEAARDATAEVQERLARFDVSTALSETLAVMAETKRLHRLGTWELLPERYDVVRRGLIRIKASGSSLTDGQRSQIQSAIQHFASMEKQVERFLAAPDRPQPSVPRLNAIVTRQLDVLTELMSDLRARGE